MTDVLTTARAMTRAGLCVVPVRQDGSKVPDLPTWKAYERTRSTPEEVEAWFASGGRTGLGLICGAVSGGLEMFELEGRALAEGLLDQLADRMREKGHGDVWDRVSTGYAEATPSGGVHFLLRVTGGPALGNSKLAYRPSTADELAAEIERRRQRIAAHRAARTQPAEQLDAQEAHLDDLTPEDVPQVLMETRGEGGFVVTAPSHGLTHASRRPWALLAGSVDTIAVLTVEERDALYAVARTFDAMPVREPAPRKPRVEPSDPGELSPLDHFNRDADWETDPGLLVAHGWEVVKSGRGLYREWVRPGKDLREGISATTGVNDADQLYVFSTSTGFEAQRSYTKAGAWGVLNGYDLNDFSSITRELRKLGWGSPRTGGETYDPDTDAASMAGAGARRQAPRRDGAAGGAKVIPLPTGGGEGEGKGAPDPTGPKHSHIIAATVFVEHHGEEYRYAHDLPGGQGWHIWDGQRWAPDETGAAWRACIELLLTITDGPKHQREADIRGVLNVAAHMLPLACTTKSFDVDPYLLNTPTGTLDLRTVTLRAHDPADFLTKVTAAPYDPAATGEAFPLFLAQVLPDPEVRAYVQRLAGYALLGKVEEHVLPIWYGPGGSGKTTLFTVLLAALGKGYGVTVDPELLLEQKYGQHPTGLTDLRGARLAVTSETDEGRKLAAATVKRLTGGDTIRARKMRQDFFEFVPSHTLIFTTNHRPEVDADDSGMWRRLQIVPFDQVPEKEDSKLPEKLNAELAAVLAWMVEGWRAYCDRGLDAPAAIKAQTADYRTSADTLGRFIDERVRTLDSTASSTRSSVLFAAWSRWCKDNGEEAGTERTFAEALKRRGVQKTKSNGVMVWKGVDLYADEDDER